MDDLDLNKIEQLARSAHQGQYRRDGQTPYVTHPERVAGRVNDPREKAVAWLHDVLEDTPLTADDLAREGVPPDVIEAVRLLTKSADADYHDYLRRIRANDLARTVKINDMLDNLSDGPRERQIVKYARGLLILFDAEHANPA